MSFSSQSKRIALTIVAAYTLCIPATNVFGQQPAKTVPKPAPLVKPVAQPIVSSVVKPTKIVLRGLYEEVHPVVDGKTASGSVVDVTDKAVLTSSDVKVAIVDKQGVVRPISDGKTSLLVTFQGKETRIPIEVSGILKRESPSFVKDVIPVLTRTGCNMGGCHGAAQGKGNFRLSLQGFDPEFDHEAITRAYAGRRLSPAQPERSLLLRKPTFEANHKGGQRFRVGDADWKVLRDWIAAGTPAPLPKEPEVVGLEIVPPTRTLAVGAKQKFTVWAKYSNGTRRDATGQTLFTASEEAVASVLPSGIAKVNGVGEGAILARYQGLVATAHIVSPFATPISRPSAKYASMSKVDELVNRKLDSLGLPASPRSTDSDFLRRAYLDITGILPPTDVARAFLADKSQDKRIRLVDRLLASPEYVDYWTLRWGDILKSSRRVLGDKGMNALNVWIRESVRTNKPWSQMASELLVAEGSAFKNGAVNYYRASTNPQALTEATSQIFLGVRIECAKCHNHPYERWTMNNYYGMAAFFARVRNKNGDRTNEPVVFSGNSGEVAHPKSRQSVVPAALDASPLTKDFAGDRRAVLAEWLTSTKNPFFAKAVVNRLWKHFMGRGLVEPVDDMRVTNPASNQPLLDWLAEDLIRNQYDLKKTMRSILLSETYQRAPEPVKGNERDTKFYAFYPFKRIPAEPLLDAISQVSGVAEKFAGYPNSVRATQLPDTAISSYFLDLFGRPARNITCACERSDEPNLGQILHLMNNSGINEKISNGNGRVAKLLAEKKTPAQIIDELYLAAFSRYPTRQERNRGIGLLTFTTDRKMASEDLMWALLNSKEFIFSH